MLPMKNVHTKNYQTQRRSAAGKHAKRWTRKKDEEANGMSTKCFSFGEWDHISRNCEETRKRNSNNAMTAVEMPNWALSASIAEGNRTGL
ncbi:hypothetical protein AVEN_73041-1 [Araneus ventricosus]|uniref:CCHC-type domain-containing protein n=1 Tax=Araneus ventricosus TaxID=182803 RepID=A0A4Y2TFZ6_ARAVE|nr:hypothetical protein AVEN_73041-1 [Araneus ventricosus]